MWGTLGPLITPAMVCVGVGCDANFLLNKQSKLVCFDHNDTTLNEMETGGRQIQARRKAIWRDQGGKARLGVFV